MSTVRKLFDLIPQQGLIGVEVEMEGQMFVTPKGWEAKHDGSLRGNSVEWVFNRPVSLDLAKKRIERLYRVNKNSGAVFKPSPRCGVHVHFNCQELEEHQVFSLALLWYVFEGLLVRWCGEGRECNPFCLRAEDADTVIDQLARALRGDRFYDLVMEWEKYTSINLHTLGRYGSVEFRTLQTPDNHEKIITWVELLHSLYQFAIRVTDVVGFVEGLSLQGSVNVLPHVFGELAKELMAIPHADQLIIRSLRTVQFAIYASRIAKPKAKKTPQELQYELMNWVYTDVPTTSTTTVRF